MQNTFPAFLDVSRAVCLVVGGGNVASRKVDSLLASGAHSIFLVSPKAVSHLQLLAKQEKIHWLNREANAEDLQLLDGPYALRLAFLCSNLRQVNATLSAACRERGILVNVADAPEESTFLLGSVVRRGPIQIAVSTGGESPSLAAELRSELEQWLDPAYEALANLLGELRREDLDRGVPIGKRREQFRFLIDQGILDVINKEGEDAARQRLREWIHQP